MRILIGACLAAAAALALVYPSMAAEQAAPPVQALNRHKIYAANELAHYRLYELKDHQKILDAGTMFFGSGSKGEKTSQSMPLVAGTDYLVLVACDEDCFDVNLRVYDAGGALVGQDLAPPRVDTRMIVSQVRVNPAKDQTYRFEVEIFCREGSTGGCTYALGLNSD